MNKRRLSLIVLLALSFSVLGAVPFAESYTAQKIAEYMSSPMPTAPAVVLVGGDFPVSVKDLSPDLAGGAATAWSGEIASVYGTFDVSLVNGTFDGEKWLLFFHVSDVHEGLYNLTLTQGTMKVHQSNSVWVLEEYPETITFSHITDIHEPIGDLLFPQFILQSNFMNPDFILATGDIVQTESNARAWAYFQYADMRYQVPFFTLPGNHDYSGYGGKGYAMYGGKLNYTLVLGDFVVIAADSGENGYFNPDQIIWIEQQLAKYPDKVKILGFHHALLSAEFEEDMGSTTGGYINVDWDNIDALADTMYFTWKNEDDGTPLEVTREIFRIIHEYDVRLILNGHVHRDMIYVVNNQHYFVTTCTSGGGLPDTQRFGSRFITVEGDGTVTLDPYSTADIANPPNNLPTGNVAYWYGSANDFSETAVSASVENMLDMSITEGRLSFKVSDNVPIESYEFTGEQPARVEKTETDGGYVFDAYYNVAPQTMFTTTLKSASDNTDPEVKTELTTPQVDYVNAVFTLTASDSGWGVQMMTVSYSVDGGDTWTQVAAGIGPILTGEVYDVTFPEPQVTISLPPLGEDATVLVKADVVDYAGNSVSYQSEELPVIEVTEYTLSVDALPSTVSITVDGTEYSTPYEASQLEGEYTITAPESVTISAEDYQLKEWSTGETGTTITVDLSADTSITVTYEKVDATEPDVTPDETDDGGGGIPFPASYMFVGVAAAALLIGLRKPRSF